MISRARKKVKEGKVIKVEVEYDEVIKNIRITGDFSCIRKISWIKSKKALLVLIKPSSEEAIASNINRIIAAEDVQMIGISPESIAGLVKEALNS